MTPPSASNTPAKETTTPDSGASLGEKVMKGTAWIVGARFAMRFIGLANTLIVAKLLVPEDFGLVAIAAMAMQVLQGFSNIGMAQAVVKFHDATRDDMDTLFTLSAIRAGIIAILLAGFGSVAAHLYDDARFIPIFLVILLNPIFYGLANPRFFEFERDLDFSKEFLALLGDKIVSVGVTIIFALIFRSYWALIGGIVAGACVHLLISYWVRPYWPRFTLVSFRKMISFSGWLAAVSFVVTLNNKFDSFILARLIGLPATGVYYLGSQLAGLITSELADPVARALYPGLSQLQGDAERMRTAFLQGVAAVGMVALPASFGVAFVAHDIVTVILAEKWRSAALVLQWLTPAYGVQALVLSMHYYAMARDKIKLVFVREVVFSLIKIPVFIWATIAYGFTGAVAAASGTILIRVILQLVLYNQVSGASALQPLWVARRSIAGVAMMAIWFFLVVGQTAILDDFPAIIRLAVNAACGAGIYSITVIGLWALEGKPAGIETRIASLLAGLTQKLSRVTG